MKKFYLFIAICLVSTSAHSERAIPSGREEYIRSLPKPFNIEYKGYRVQNIKILKDSVTYEYCDNATCFYLILEGEPSMKRSAGRSKNFYIYLSNIDETYGKELVKAIIENDTENIYIDVYENPGGIGLNLKVIYTILMLILLLLLLSLNNRITTQLERFFNRLFQIPDLLYWSLFVVILIYTSHLRLSGIYLPLVEGGSALRLLYSYDSILYNLFISNDARHPGLYFALLKPFISLSDNPVYTARIISATLSILSVGVIGLILKDENRLLSLFSMLLLSFNAEYTYRSREITDISLFVLMSLSSIWALKKVITGEKRLYYILFTIFTILSCYASYVAYVNLGGLILYLLINRKFRNFKLSLFTILIFVSPYIFKILTSLQNETRFKNISINFPEIIWGGEDPLTFLKKSLTHLFGGESAYVILALFLLYLVIIKRSLLKENLFLILFISNITFLFFFKYLRMMPYYAIFMPISFTLLICSEIKDEGFFKKSFQLLIILFTIFSFYLDMQQRYESIYIQSYHLRTNPEIPVKIIKESGVRDIVIDIEHNKSILGYYFFRNPFKILVKEGCRVASDQTLICYEEETGRRITSLTGIISINSGWREAAVERLRNLKYSDYFFVYDRSYQNDILIEYLSNNCKTYLIGEKYSLFRCRYTQD